MATVARDFWATCCPRGGVWTLRGTYTRRLDGTECIAQATFRFHSNSKPVIASFDLPDVSSDGGAVLLKAPDARLELAQRLAAAIHDWRPLGKSSIPSWTGCGSGFRAGLHPRCASSAEPGSIFITTSGSIRGIARR
jgi:hypothetical protein